MRGHDRSDFEDALDWVGLKPHVEAAATFNSKFGRRLAEGLKGEALDAAVRDAVRNSSAELSDDDVAAFVHAAVVELSFLCLQFVALTCVFTGLNIPDESFMGEVMTSTLPDRVIARLNDLNDLAGSGLPALVRRNAAWIAQRLWAGPGLRLNGRDAIVVGTG